MMKDRDLWWKIVLVGALLALSFAAVYPPREKLKYGIDLDGGYSLLYEIDDTGMDAADKAGLAEKVMRVLRERVDPKGVFNLVWRPVGNNRLEIQMPRPSPEVVAARREYETHQKEIQDTLIRRTDVMRALALRGANRERAVELIVGGNEKRRGLMAAAAAAFDEVAQTQAEYDRRVAQIEAGNLTREDVLGVVAMSGGERDAAIDVLAGGNPARREALLDAAKAWIVLESERSTTQPADGSEPSADATLAFREKEAAFDQAVNKVLATNVDPDAPGEGVTIDDVIALEEKRDAAIGAVLATNIDVGQLQTMLAADRGDPIREENYSQLTTEHPELASVIDGMVEATDRLKQRRRGEGRLEDPADLQRLLRGAGVLEFRILAERDPGDPLKYEKYVESLKTRGPRRMPGEDAYQWFPIEDPNDFLNRRGGTDLERDFDNIKDSLGIIVERFGDRYFVLAHIEDSYTMTHRFGEPDWALKRSQQSQDELGRPAIGFTLDERGGAKFAGLTSRHEKKQLCIFLDDEAISHATINTVIRTSGIIQGNFSVREVQDMVKKLNAGSLPRKLKDPPISVRAIGPSLGEANRTAGLRSVAIGAALVIAFMIIYYFYAGFVAVVAVMMNLLLTLGVMSTLGATLTLPGIAGLVLAMGMAVDANVLINERIREELDRGNTLRMAIKLGYERAFRAIIDSNVTTVLTCIILYWVGSEEIKGFGLTLGIGVVLNLFTAYFVTRIFFEMMSLQSIPGEVWRYPLLTALGIAAFGGLLWGGGYLLNDEAQRAESVMMLFGEALMEIAPAVVALMLLMILVRTIHGSPLGRGNSRVPMMHLVGVPKVGWTRLKPIFIGGSLVLTIGGLLLFFNLSKDDLYDIEFLGGTAAQIDLKEPGSLDQAEIAERLDQSSSSLARYAGSIRKATVTGGAGAYTLANIGMPASRLEPVVKAVMDTADNRALNEIDGVRYSEPGSREITIRTRTDADVSLDDMKAYLEAFAQRFERASEAIGDAQVQAVAGVGGEGEKGKSFEVVTLESNKDIVVGAIMESMQNELDVQPALTFELLEDASSGGAPYFAISDDNPRKLGLPISDQEVAQLDLAGWKGGVAMILDQLTPPQKIDVLKDRLRAMRLQPGFESHGWRESEVFGVMPAAPGSDRYSRVMVVVADENFPLLDEQGAVASAWVSELAEPEVKLLEEALQRQTSLSQVTQFDQQVSGEAKTSAFIAVALSWLAIILYVWFRFGSVRWGFAAVAALVHDVFIAIGAVALCHYVAETVFGRGLLLENFRVDLALVAALLTVIGYSVNDTIIVFDRIRENRGRLNEVNPEMVDKSINQTLARTVLTSFSTLLTLITMYIVGGPGIHGFSFVMLIGIITGTYSSFAIAAQVLVWRKAPKAAQVA